MTRRKVDPRAHSRLVFDGVKQTPSRAMLRAVGFTDRGFPQAAGRHRLDLEHGHAVQHAHRQAGERGRGRRGRRRRQEQASSTRSPCPTASRWARRACATRWFRARSSPTRSRRSSGAQGFDGFVAIGGCDKNMPGCVMAMARLNRPAVFVYGGTIRPGAQSNATSCPSSRRSARTPQRQDHRQAAARSRAHRDPGRGLLRRHVHGQHHGLGHRGARHEPAQQLGAGGDLDAPSARTPAAPARPWCALIKRGHPAVRHPDAARRSRTPSP